MPEIYDNQSMDDVIERFRRSSSTPVEWSAPSPGMWDRITKELAFSPPAAPETSAPAPQGSAPANPGRRALFFGAGGLVVGAALGVAGFRFAGSVADVRDAAVKRAVLTPLDKADEKLGIAELRPEKVGYTLVVDVPKGVTHTGGYVQVWLINVDGKRMISVGIFTAGTAGDFFIDDALIDAGYLIVDLSNEEFDDEPRHSGDTIMRGELRA
ncbi:anti-sigma factor [Tessaracoccus antarcticus]|uniref:Anti-sigma factor n=1 Tax=Tessaracoccus antarcticus TaxID=2479848 RepID=A0A3M0FYF8_9ACTN|nr:anti-sigma factor [Tessaracoccus antarcticus]RMB57495.1 anti-sigma factor [Tessaracoccus antarcticus]